MYPWPAPSRVSPRCPWPSEPFKALRSLDGALSLQKFDIYADAPTRYHFLNLIFLRFDHHLPNRSG